MHFKFDSMVQAKRLDRQPNQNNQNSTYGRSLYETLEKVFRDKFRDASKR